MSRTYNVLVVVGIEIDTIKRVENIIKYNEDNGEPYSINVSKTYYCVNEMIFNHLSDITDYFALEIHKDVLGVVLDSFEFGSANEIDLDEVCKMKNNVKDKFGLFGLSVDPKLYCIPVVY